MKKIFMLPMLFALFCATAICHAELPGVLLNNKLGSSVTSSATYAIDAEGNWVKRYQKPSNLKNVNKLLPVELEKVMGQEVENFDKFFFISADELYYKNTKRMVMSSVMVGGGAEAKIEQHLVKNFGQPRASYEINNEFPGRWFEPRRISIWEDKEQVMVLLSEYNHGLRSKVKIMSKDFYDTLTLESEYLKN